MGIAENKKTSLRFGNAAKKARPTLRKANSLLARIAV
jgi:hypothetical protein